MTDLSLDALYPPLHPDIIITSCLKSPRGIYAQLLVADSVCFRSFELDFIMY